MMFKFNISKQSKNIAASFIVVLGLSLVMITFDLSRMRDMQDKMDVITKEHNVKQSLMVSIQSSIYERQIGLRNIILLSDPFEKDAARTAFNQHAFGVIKTRDIFLSMSLSQQERELFKKIMSGMTDAYELQQNIITKSIFDESHKFTHDEMQETFDKQSMVTKRVNEMVRLQQNSSAKAEMEADKSYQEAKSSVFILGGSSLIFGLLVALFVIRLNESNIKKADNAILDLKQSHELLEARVQERTYELAEARDDALASNKAKDNFIANMSHELRTPLNIIIGYSEILEEEAVDKSLEGFVADLKKIKSAAHHQLKLVSSILDISKIEEGKLDISPIDFDIENLILEVVEETKLLILRNNNIFEVNCMHGIGMMYSDNMRIYQILLNLISNAAKFTRDGKISLEVSKDENGDTIFYKLCDTGNGISEEYLKYLFEEFTQADNSTTRKYGGTGLGLAISKKLSEHLHGKLTVTSELNKGSCFTLSVPTIFIEDRE
ncbi:MAG: ATP-binding protein [Woeseiaceae bacterium]